MIVIALGVFTTCYLVCRASNGDYRVCIGLAGLITLGLCYMFY